MKRIIVLAVCGVLVAVMAAVVPGSSQAADRVCAQWAVKPYRHCVRYAPTPTTTTTTTTTLPPTTTAPPDTSLCDLGSDFRQLAYNDTIHFYIYADNRDQVNLEASVIAYVCVTVDPSLAAAAQAVVDCFAGGTGPACIQTPENPAGVFQGIVYFAQALVPPAPEPPDATMQDVICRENGVGRQHAIGDVYAYETTWGQTEADAMVADAELFIIICGGYPGTDTLRADAQVLVDCLNGWAGALPHFQACYLPGNEINRYLHDLLVSSR